MKILFVANCSIMFGANRSMMDLAIFLKEKNEEIFFLLPEHGAIESLLKKEKFAYAVFPYKPCVYDIKYRHKYLSILRKAYVRIESLVYNLRMLPKIVEVIRKWKPDIVHSNSSTCDIGYYIARDLNCTHVWHIREMLRAHYNMEYNFKKQIKRFFHSTDVVIYISDTVRKYSKKEEMHGKNNVVIYNGFAIETYENIKNEFMPNDDLHILLCSNLYEQKGYMDALSAVKILIREREKDVKLFIAGTGSEADLKNIQNFIEDNGLEKNIALKGFQENLAPLRAWADVELNCSMGEALGRTTVEAMLAEVLVIGAASGATDELIEEKVNGLKYVLRDPHNLAEQLEYAVSHKDECLQMIKNAKRYAVKNFDNDIQAEKIWSIYKKAVW